MSFQSNLQCFVTVTRCSVFSVQVVINKHAIDLLSGALSGVNIGPCSHPCAGSPCMNGGECEPILDKYTCSCPIGFGNTNCEDGNVSHCDYIYNTYFDLMQTFFNQIQSPKLCCTFELMVHQIHMQTQKVCLLLWFCVCFGSD